MQWRSAIARNNTLSFGIAAGILFASFGVATTALAADTQIGAVVCGADAPGAHVTLAQPLNDSVHSQPIVTFRGQVSNTSQLEVSIDDNVDRIIAIGADQSSFAFDLTFSSGTHTVSIQANDICNGNDATSTVTLTYQPAIEPSSGEATPTALDGTLTLDGEPVEVGEGAPDQEPNPIEQLPVIGPIYNAVKDMAQSTGLEATVSNNNASIATGAARVGLTVFAMTSIVMASSLAPAAVHVLPGVSEIFHMETHRSLIYLEWVIRAFGILALGIAYFL